ncbi:LamG-like jellyroll fold domain-containing protein [Hahella sp. NBU794]|uniref:LamG-like jellyroll fold domain-containing protein n=1 Tax=Hahella sp. NBU794 TaxID=3422590 RepID=UPI003D6E90E9
MGISTETLLNVIKRSLSAVLILGASIIYAAPSSGSPQSASYEAAVLADSPIAYWRLNETSEQNIAEDKSGNGHQAKVEGNLPLESGILSSDSAKSFSSGGLSVPNHPSFAVEQLTLEAWLKPYRAGTDGSSSFLFSHGGSNYNWGLYESKNRSYCLYVRIGVVKSVCVTQEEVPTNSWSHLVGTYNGSSLILYLNGHEKARLDISGVPTNTPGVIQFSNWSGYRFEGALDEVAIYDHALNESTIKRHYQLISLPALKESVYRKVVSGSNPVSYWELPEMDGKVIDLVGDINGVATQSTQLTQGVSGADHAASYFDYQLSQRIVVPHNPNHNLKEFSVEAWVKPEVTGAYRGIITKMMNGNGYPGMALRVDGATGTKFQFAINSSRGLIWATAPNTFELGEWYHLVGRYKDGVGASLYVNGELVDSTAANEGTLIVTPSVPLVIGTHYNYNFTHLNFGGVIDSAVFYSHLLSEREIKAHYDAALTGIEPQSKPAKIVGASIPDKSTLTERSDIEIYFESPIDESSFAQDDVRLTKDGSEQRIKVKKLDDVKYALEVVGGIAHRAHYVLEVGPNISSGNVIGLDQDGDALYGEVGDDVFKLSFDTFFADFVITDEATIGDGASEYEDKNILIDSGLLTISGDHNFSDILLVNGGKIVTPDRAKASLNLSYLSIDKSSSIDVSGKGAAPDSEVRAYCGGSYGGEGGSHDWLPNKNVFGDYRRPHDLGIGGAGNNDASFSTGGGAIKVIVDRLELDGKILANGSGGENRMGAGSGGSVWIEAGVIVGSGSIAANGGNRVNTTEGGGGGGGRIAIYYNELESFDINAQVETLGGKRVHGSYESGAAGTIYVRNRLTGDDKLIIDSRGMDDPNVARTGLSGSYPTPVEIYNARIKIMEATFSKVVAFNTHVAQKGDVNAESIFLHNGVWQQSGNKLGITEDYSFDGGGFDSKGELSLPNNKLVVDNYILTVYGDQNWSSVILKNAGVLTIGSTLAPPTHALRISASSIIIEKGATLDVSKKGNYPDAEICKYCGGSYGGIGGSTNGQLNKQVYGDYRQPVESGTGGLGANESSRSRGGGAVIIKTDNLQLDGVISANGENLKQSNSNVGGGSGGSILLDVGVLSGNGLLQANGGESPAGGGGAGGRIAIYYSMKEAFDFASQVRVAGGKSGLAAYADGQNGSVYTEQKHINTYVTGLSVTDYVADKVQEITLSFVNEIDPASFSIDDILLVDNGSPVSIFALEQINGVQYRIRLSTPLEDGTYRLTVGPDIKTKDGLGMDQNQNGVPNEADDAFVASFVVDTEKPAAPTVTSHNVSIPVLVNTRIVNLSGVKEPGTSIWLNGKKVSGQDNVNWTISNIALQEGDNQLLLKVGDLAGNFSDEFMLAINVDSHAPEVLTMTPLGIINSSDNSIRVKAEDVGASGLSLKGASVAAYRNGLAVAGQLALSSGEYTFTATAPLLEGSYKVVVKVADTRGNISAPKEYTFILDSTKPASPQLEAFPDVTDVNAYRFKGTREKNSGVWVNGVQKLASEDKTTFDLLLDLERGDNRFEFVVIDAAGNASVPTIAKIRFDDTAPGQVTYTVDGKGDGTEAALDWTVYDEFANGNDIAAYHIYVSGSNFSDIAGMTPAASTSSGAKTFKLAGLMRGATVYVAVVAEDAAGLKRTAVTAQAVTPEDIVKPEPVSELRALSASTSIDLSWAQHVNAAGDLAGYRVYVNKAGSEEVKDIPLASANISDGRVGFTVEGLQAATANPIRITAYDLAGNESAAVSNPGVTLLANPAGVTTDPLSGQLKVSWQASQPANLVKEYRIYAQDAAFSSVAGMAPKTTVSGSALTRNIAGLSNGVTYYVAVTAVNLSGGEETQVAAVTGKPEEDNVGPEIASVEFVSANGSAQLSGSTLAMDGKVVVKANDPAGVSRVEFEKDGESWGMDLNADPDFERAWLLAGETDGAHTISVSVYDNLNNVTQIKNIPVSVDLAAPLAPQLTAPLSGVTTNKVEVDVAGTATANTLVQLFVNGEAQGETYSVEEAGVFSGVVSLQNGVNVITAKATYVGRTKVSAASESLSVTLDDTLPNAPQSLSAVGKALGKVALGWMPVNDPRVKGYNLYRSTDSFSTIAEAGAPVNQKLITGTSYTDVPFTDGVYFYRVASVNELGSLSELSEVVDVKADSEAPKAVKVEYMAYGARDEASGRFGSGLVDLAVTFDEPLRNPPYFALAMENALPLTVELERDFDDELLYRGQFEIEATTPAGVVTPVLAAFDSVGNRGSLVVSGSDLRIDTQGPDVRTLTVNPAAPIRNDDPAGKEVEVVLTLADDVNPGEEPKLVPFIEENGAPTVIADYQDGITLSKDGSSQEGRPVYVGRMRLPLTAGQDQDGQPNAEQLGFLLSAQDDLGNPAKPVPAHIRFQVYQGELPPLGAPDQLTGKALPGGRVALNWSLVGSAAGYTLYRKAPGEAELSEWKRFDDVLTDSYIDGEPTPLVDGEYQYAIASLRSENGQTTASAPGVPVSINSDATAPTAPASLQARLSGSGVYLQWQAPAGDGLRYNVYRLNLPETAEDIDLSDVAALQENLPKEVALDSKPSETEHLYMVTAVDSAGNESAPSNTQYVNADLLPVNQLSVLLENYSRPVVNWSHNGASIAGYDIYVGDDADRVKLNADLLTNADYEDLGYNAGEFSSGSVEERFYTVVAKDNQGKESIGHSLLLPALSVDLKPADESENSVEPIKRGVMNRVLLRVANSGVTKVERARLKVTVNVAGAAKSHYSDYFAVEPGSFSDVGVVIGGYQSLDAFADLDISILWSPQAGENVEIRQWRQVAVGQSALVATLETLNFVRGATGKARFRLENVSDVESEILMAANSGKSDSPDIRFILEDFAGNVYGATSIKQVTGDVVTTTDRSTVARIPAGGEYVTEYFDVPVSSSVPESALLRLEIDKLHYQVGRDTHVAIAGTRASQVVTLQETPYYGELTSVEPAKAFAGETVTIKGRAIDRASNEPMANAILTVAMKVRGFERQYAAFTDVQGQFEFTYTPTINDTGEYVVSIVHPDKLDRPEHSRFIVEGASVAPAIYKVSVPRNYEYGMDVRVKAGFSTQLTNVRLEWVAELDEDGQPKPMADGLQVSSSTLEAIAPNTTGYLKLKLTGDNLAPENGRLYFKVMTDNQEQPLALLTVQYYLSAAAPLAKVSPSYITSGVKLGDEQGETFKVTNGGLETLTNARLSLVDQYDAPAPEWVRIVGDRSLGNIAVNESHTIQLAFRPDATVPKGDYRFKVLIQGDNLPTQPYIVDVAVTDSTIGGVHFHTSDIYTATKAENGGLIPGLAKVRISLQNEDVLSETYEIYTDEFGDGFLENLSTGSYTYRASAFDHDSVSGRIWVRSGAVTSEEVFLMNKLISVEFSVREITLEDRYEVVLNATYETNVPAPVVLFEPMSVNLPMMKKGEVFQGEFSLTNYGLVAAEDVKSNLTKGDSFARFEYFGEIPDTLFPGQVVVVPYRIIALQDFDPSADGDASGAGCANHNYNSDISFSSPCANGNVAKGNAGINHNAAGGSSCSSSGGGGLGLGGGTLSSSFGGLGSGVTASPAPTKSQGIGGSFCPGADAGGGGQCSSGSAGEGGGN